MDSPFLICELWLRKFGNWVTSTPSREARVGDPGFQNLNAYFRIWFIRVFGVNSRPKRFSDHGDHPITRDHGDSSDDPMTR
jgi:hypothetical protein